MLIYHYFYKLFLHDIPLFHLVHILFSYTIFSFYNITESNTYTKKVIIPLMISSLFLPCGRWDLNPHEHTPTRSLVLPVCQFQHFRINCLLLTGTLVILSQKCLFVKYFFHPHTIYQDNTIVSG